jgi:AraC-like DNA-binding protein
MPDASVLPVNDISLAELATLEQTRPGGPIVLFRDAVDGGWNYRLRHVDFRSLYIAERGEGRHIIDDTAYGIARGDVYLMSAGSNHTFAAGRRMLLHAVHFGDAVFDPETWATLAAVPGFDQLLVAPNTSRRLHLSPDAYGEVARDLAELWAEWRSDSPASGLLVRALLLRLLVHLARVAADEPPPPLDGRGVPPHRDEIVASALRSIDLAHGGPLRVRDLAAAAYLSADRFTEVFASVTGRTPRDYIRHVRLERASTLLATSALTITEIARMSGFRDGAHFSHTFRAHTGHSPRDFRRMAQSAD